MKVRLKNLKPKNSSKEDIGLSIAIEKGKKSGFVSEGKVFDILHKIRVEPF